MNSRPKLSFKERWDKNIATFNKHIESLYQIIKRQNQVVEENYDGKEVKYLTEKLESWLTFLEKDITTAFSKLEKSITSTNEISNQDKLIYETSLKASRLKLANALADIHAGIYILSMWKLKFDNSNTTIEKTALLKRSYEALKKNAEIYKAYPTLEDSSLLYDADFDMAMLAAEHNSYSTSYKIQHEIYPIHRSITQSRLSKKFSGKMRHLKQALELAKKEKNYLNQFIILSEQSIVNRNEYQKDLIPAKVKELIKHYKIIYSPLLQAIELLPTHFKQLDENTIMKLRIKCINSCEILSMAAQNLMLASKFTDNLEFKLSIYQHAFFLQKQVERHTGDTANELSTIACHLLEKQINDIKQKIFERDNKTDDKKQSVLGLKNQEQGRTQITVNTPKLADSTIANLANETPIFRERSKSMHSFFLLEEYRERKFKQGRRLFGDKVTVCNTREDLLRERRWSTDGNTRTEWFVDSPNPPEFLASKLNTK